MLQNKNMLWVREKSPKWFLINCVILRLSWPWYSAFPCEQKENFTLHQKSVKAFIPCTPFLNLLSYRLMRWQIKQKSKTPSHNKWASFAVKWETKPFEGTGYAKEKKNPWSTEASSLWEEENIKPAWQTYHGWYVDYTDKHCPQTMHERIH